MLTISQIAKAANVSIETVRYYHRRNILPEPMKPAGGHRRYSRRDVERLQFIKRAQTLGFSLDEVENLLQLDGTNSCAETHEMAVQKLAVIQEKLATLTSIQAELSELVRQCEIGNLEGCCPILRSLSEPEGREEA